MRALGQLGIPIFYQEKSYSCGAAAVRSVVSYLTGLDIPEKALRSALETNPEMGTDPDDMVSFLSRLPNLKVHSRTLTVEDLRRCVDNGEVVIVDLQAWSEEKNPDYRKGWLDGHYVVLSGYEGSKFLFADPSSEKTAFLEASILEQRWHDEDDKGLRSERLGIVCTPRIKTMRTASQRRVGRIFSLRVAMETKRWGPFEFKLDRPKGFKKEWPQDDGSVKKYTYPVDYGYFIGHTGEDDEGLDAFIGDDPEGKIESFLKMKPGEDGEALVPDETKFLIGLTSAERKKVLGLYQPEEIVGLREFGDVYELVAVLNAFRDRKAAARIATKFLRRIG